MKIFEDKLVWKIAAGVVLAQLLFVVGETIAKIIIRVFGWFV